MATPGNHTILIVLFVPLVVSFAAFQSATLRVLGTGVSYWSSSISYSIYVTDLLVLEWLEAPVRSMLSQVHVPH